MSSNELKSYNMVLQQYLKQNPGQTAANVDPSQIVEYAKVNNFQIFDNNEDTNAYVVQGQNVVFQDKSGGFLDFNTESGAETSLTQSQLDQQLGCGSNNVVLQEDSAVATGYDFNGKSSITTNGNVTNQTVAVDLSTSTGQNEMTNAINQYAAANGNPTSLSQVFGNLANDSNVIINPKDPNSMVVVQNGQAYVVSDDGGTPSITSITTSETNTLGGASNYSQLSQFGITPPTQNDGVDISNFAVTNGKLTYSLNCDSADITNSSVKTDIANAVNTYAAATGVNPASVDLHNVLSSAEADTSGNGHVFSESGSTNPYAIYVQNGNAYSVQMNSNGTLTETPLTDASASTLSKFGVTLPSNASTTDPDVHDFTLAKDSNATHGFDLNYDYNTATGSSSTGTSQSNGDPHFDYNGTYAFDFQGVEGGNSYTMLDNSDINVTGTFGEYYGTDLEGSTVMTKETIDLKQSGISVSVNANGTYAVAQNGTALTPGTSAYTSALSAAGVSISDASNVVTVTEGNRSIAVQCNETYMNNTNITTESGDTGLLTQTQEALSGKYDAGQYIVGGDSDSGISAPVLLYADDSSNDEANSLAAGMISTLTTTWGASGAATEMNSIMNDAIPSGYQLASNGTLEDASGAAVTPSSTLSATDITSIQSALAMKAALATYSSSGTDANKTAATTAMATWITDSSAAMQADINSGTGSIASRFQSGHGYSTSQWNEYFGTIENDAGSNVVKNADGTDKGMMVNGVEKDFLINPDNIFIKNGTSTF